MLKEKYPEDCFTIINKGICGNTIEGLKLRWQSDVIKQIPDLLFILIGINDVHVTRDHTLPEEQRISHFKSLYSFLILNTYETLPDCSIVLLSPFYICNNTKNPIFKTTEKYRDVVKNMSILFELPFIDLHSLFQRELVKSDGIKWSKDRVHPTPEGHQYIACKIYEYVKQSTLFRETL